MKDIEMIHTIIFRDLKKIKSKTKLSEISFFNFYCLFFSLHKLINLNSFNLIRELILSKYCIKSDFCK